MSDAKDKIRNILKDAGIVPTKQRMSIANLLFSKHQHISAEQLRYQINKIDKNISRATVYNTLSLFSEKELLNKVVTETNQNDEINKGMNVYVDKGYGKPFNKKKNSECNKFTYDLIPGSKEEIEKLSRTIYQG